MEAIIILKQVYDHRIEDAKTAKYISEAESNIKQLEELIEETKVVERERDYCKTKNGNVYRVKVGIFGNNYGFIGNTDKPLLEFIRGML